MGFVQNGLHIIYATCAECSAICDICKIHESPQDAVPTGHGFGIKPSLKDFLFIGSPKIT